MDRKPEKTPKQVLRDLYSSAAFDRVEIALRQWNMSHPGVRPDYLIVGEQIRSMMLIAGVLDSTGGTHTYGQHLVLFCDAFDVCMFASKCPS